MKFILGWRKEHAEVIIEFQILRAKVVNAKLFEVSKDGSDCDVDF